MEQLDAPLIDEDRLEDCRDVIEPELIGLIQSNVACGFTLEETLIAISELVAEEYAIVMKAPSVH